MPIPLGYLASDLQDTPASTFPVPELQTNATIPGFSQGSEHLSDSCHSKHCSDWASLPAPQLNFSSTNPEPGCRWLQKTEDPTQGHSGVNRTESIISQSCKSRGRAVHLANSAMPSLEYQTPQVLFNLMPRHLSMLTVSGLTPPISKNWLLHFQIPQQQMSHWRDEAKLSKPSVIFHRHF